MIPTPKIEFVSGQIKLSQEYYDYDNHVRHQAAANSR